MTVSTGTVPGRIFMSYRRDDTDYPAAWLYERLASHFGRRRVFKDIDSIELGDDFVESIATAIQSCEVLLALIGHRWLTAADLNGQRRLDDPNDFVRVEIEAALRRNVRVIPVLVEGARMPRADELPASMAQLTRRQALELSPGRFDLDTQRLLRVLDQATTRRRDENAPKPDTQRSAKPAPSPTSRSTSRPLSWVTKSRIRMSLLAAAAIVVASGTVVAISLSGGPGRQPSGRSGRQTSGSSGGQPIAPIATLQNPINSHGISNAPQAVAFGQSGKTLAVGSVNTHSRDGSGPTYLWDVATKRPTATLTDPRSQGVHSVAFCGRTLAVVDGNGKVYLWNAATKRRTATLTDPGSRGELSVSFGLACKTVAVGDGNGNVYLWDVATKRHTATLPDPGSKAVSSVAYALGGRTLAASDGNGKVYVWDVPTKRITATATFTIPQSGGILTMAISPGGGTLAAAGGTNGNSKVYLWDADTNTITTLGNPPGQVIDSLRFAPDGTTLAVGGSYGNVYLWDTATKRIFATLAPHRACQRMNSVAFGTGETTVAAGCGNGQSYLWNIAGHV